VALIRNTKYQLDFTPAQNHIRLYMDDAGNSTNDNTEVWCNHFIISDVTTEDIVDGGVGNILAFKYRIHDAEIGRFLSRDPLAKTYPFYSPYQFAANTPIAAVDLEGLEAAIKIRSQWYERKIKKAVNANDIREAARLTMLAYGDPAKDKYGRKMFGINNTAATFNYSEAYAKGLTVSNSNGDILFQIADFFERPEVTLQFEDIIKKHYKNKKDYKNLQNYTEPYKVRPIWGDIEKSFSKLSQEVIRRLASIFGDAAADGTNRHTVIPTTDGGENENVSGASSNSRPDSVKMKPIPRLDTIYHKTKRTNGTFKRDTIITETTDDGLN
jgi:RHS repeat-associated protein